MCKIGIGMCRRTDTLLQHVPLTCNGRRSVAAYAGEELGLSKGRFTLRPGRAVGLLVLLAIAAQAVDSEEVLQFLGEVAVAIEGLVGRHWQAREDTFLIWGRGGSRRRAEDLRHRGRRAADLRAAPRERRGLAVGRYFQRLWSRRLRPDRPEHQSGPVGC